MFQNSPMIFIAFIGTGDYIPTTYTAKGKGAIQAKFVQNAVRKLFAPEAEALIFATPEAKGKYLPDDQEQSLPQEQDPLFQLFRQNFWQESKRLGLSMPKVIDIPNGENMQELWQIFKITYDNIPQGSRICFDPTHAFRHQPLIMTILFNYLHVVKNVDVVHCEYGAWEANTKKPALEKHFKGLRGQRSSTAATPENDTDFSDESSPLFPLTEFFQLNNWTNAIHDFLEYGRTEALKRLMTKKKGSKASKTQKEIYNFINILDQLANYALVSNLHEISLLNFEDKIFTPLKNIQESQEKLDFMPQLAPLFQRLEERLSQFNFTPTPSWENGFAMARWCLQFKLHPQLYTILQETCVSATLALISKHICTKTELQQAGLSTELPAKLQEIRDYISSLLGINLEVQEIETLRYPLIPEQQEYEDEHEYAQAKQCRLALNTKIANDSNIQAIQSLYQKITTFRNAINHGFMASAADRKIPSRSKNKNMIDDIENAFKDAMCL